MDRAQLLFFSSVTFLTIMVSSQSLASDKDIVLRELKVLNIEAASFPVETEELLPDKLTGPYWGLLKNICSESGWDLPGYAGKKVLFYSFSTKEKYGDEPLKLWVIAYSDKIVCVYKTVVCEENNTCVAPGILPVRNPRKD